MVQEKKSINQMSSETEIKQIRELNEKKHLIEIGDLAIFNLLIGRVIEVNYDEDVWNPIEVIFEGLSGTYHCDAQGGSSLNDKLIKDVKFYKLIK